MFDFEVKIAQSNEEIEQALRLRYEVFKLELAKRPEKKHTYNLAANNELDVDKYDPFCDHLIVIDRISKKIVGTYRLMLSSRANKDIGFYSENFFDISNIKRLAGECEILELGRSCVHRDYRTHFVINLLWNGIAEYIKDYKVRYLFGSTRLLTERPEQVSKIYKFLKSKYYVEPKFQVSPKPENKFNGLREDIKVDNPKEILSCLPPLLKGYLRAGVSVCGPPAINKDLGSVVIFILLDVSRIPRPYKRHYLKDSY